GSLALTLPAAAERPSDEAAVAEGEVAAQRLPEPVGRLHAVLEEPAAQVLGELVDGAPGRCGERLDARPDVLDGHAVELEDARPVRALAHPGGAVQPHVLLGCRGVHRAAQGAA